MVAPSFFKFKRELAPPLLNQNHLHPLLGFLSGFAAHVGFRRFFIDSRRGGFPTLATGFRRLRSIVGEISRVRVS
jgi:hypothetical protein